MPLVPEKIYMEWFHPDHWMYRQFSYCYSNALWTKNVPTGYSLCPYFWQSILVGFLFLRCFLVPVSIVTMAISRLVIKIVGKTGSKIFLRMGKFLSNISGKLLSESSKDNMTSDAPAAAFACLIACLFVVGGAAIIAALYGVFWLVAFATITISAKVVLCNIVLIGVVCIPCGIYYRKNQYEDDRCKVENYVKAVVVIVLLQILALLCYWAFMYGGAILSYSWNTIICNFIWDIFCCTWISGAFVWCTSLVWTIICGAGIGIFKMFVYAPLGNFIPWWVFLGLFYAFIWYVAKNIPDHWLYAKIDKLDERKQDSFNRTLSIEWDWQNMFMDEIIESSIFVRLIIRIGHFRQNKEKDYIGYHNPWLAKTMLQKLCNKFYIPDPELYNISYKDYKRIKDYHAKACKDYNISTKYPKKYWFKIAYHLKIINEDQYDKYSIQWINFYNKYEFALENDRFWRTYIRLYIHGHFSELEKRKKRNAESRAKKEAEDKVKNEQSQAKAKLRAQRLRHWTELCNKTTTAVGKILDIFITPAAKFSCYIGKIFLAIGVILASVYKFVKQTLCYFKDRAKSKKQGWCPYIRFDDVNK